MDRAEFLKMVKVKITELRELAEKMPESPEEEAPAPSPEPSTLSPSEAQEWPPPETESYSGYDPLGKSRPPFPPPYPEKYRVGTMTLKDLEASMPMPWAKTPGTAELEALLSLLDKPEREAVTEIMRAARKIGGDQGMVELARNLREQLMRDKRL